MTQNTNTHHEDPGDDGEVLREEREHRILFAQDGLAFSSLVLDDPKPSGAQILDAGGVADTSQWSLVTILPTGDFEDVRPSEAFDIRGKGAERFIAFRTDRLFRLLLRDRVLLWGRPTIAGSDILELAKPGPDEAVFLDVPGGTDKPITAETVVDLTEPWVERIIVAPKPKPETFEVSIIFNGLVKKLTVHPDNTVAQVITAARPLFGSPGGDLVLVAQDGRELQPAHTLRQEGIHPNERLSLRPPVVRGG
jgi:hypothetical protein